MRIHSTANIFVCPERIFQINEDGSIPDQPCPVDYWTEEGRCSYCGISDRTIESSIVRILELIGEDPNRPGLKGTPSRIAKMYKEIFKGYDPSKKPDMVVLENGADGIVYDEMIFDHGSLASWCEHHMLAFRGHYFFGFIPDKSIIGLSKVARIVDYYSSKLQIQERLVKEIADELEKVLSPKGLGVMLKASHLCKEIRGIRNEGEMITSDLRGIFRDELRVREEFLALIGLVEKR